MSNSDFYVVLKYKTHLYFLFSCFIILNEKTRKINGGGDPVLIDNNFVIENLYSILNSRPINFTFVVQTRKQKLQGLRNRRLKCKNV